MARIMAHAGSGFTTEVNSIKAHAGSGFTTTINRVWAYDGSDWEEVWPLGGGTPPPGGTTEVTLNPTSLSIPSTGKIASASFATAPYMGKIVSAWAVISWKSLGSGDSDVYDYGGTSGSYIRNIAQDSGWADRTISHQIDAAVSRLNNGTSKGYLLDMDIGSWPSAFISNMKLKLEYNL